jgi:hypothetical protein
MKLQLHEYYSTPETEIQKQISSVLIDNMIHIIARLNKTKTCDRGAQKAPDNKFEPIFGFPL